MGGCSVGVGVTVDRAAGLFAGNGRRTAHAHTNTVREITAITAVTSKGVTGDCIESRNDYSVLGVLSSECGVRNMKVYHALYVLIEQGRSKNEQYHTYDRGTDYDSARQVNIGGRRQ